MSRKIKVILFESFISETDLIKEVLLKHESTINLQIWSLDAINEHDKELLPAEALIINSILLDLDNLKKLKRILKSQPEISLLLLSQNENEENTIEFCEKLNCTYILLDKLYTLNFWINQIIKQKNIIRKNKKVINKLKESEQELKAILNTAPECIKLLNEDYEIIQINPAGLDMLDIKEEQELEQYPIMKIIDKDCRKDFQKLHKKALKGTTSKMELKITTIKGTKRILEAHFSPFRNNEGTITATLSISRDITESKKAEKELKQSEEKFRAIVENSYESIGLFNPEMGFLYQSPQLSKLLGFGINEEASFSNIYKDDRKRLNNILDISIANPGIPFKTELRLQKEDGEIIWLKIVFTNFMENKYVNAIVINAHEITDRILNQQALVEREKTLDHVFSFAPIALLISRIEDGKILNANDSACKILGLNKGDLHAKSTLDYYFNKNDREHIIKLVLEKGKIENYETMMRNDGHIIEVLESISIITYNNEKVMLKSFFDLSEKKKLDEAISISELTYKELFEKSPLGIITLDKEGNINTVNEEIVRMSGYAKEEYIGRSILDLPYRVEILNFNKVELLREILAGNFKIRYLESKLYKKNGEVVFHEIRLNFIPKIGKYILIATDVTIKKALIEELNESKKKYKDIAIFNEMLLDHAPFGILSYKADTGNCISVNRAIEQISGGTKEEILAQNYKKLDHWKTSGMFTAAEEALNTNKNITLEIQTISTFGKQLWLLGQFIPFTNHDGLHLLVFVEDISQKKEAERALMLNQKLFSEIANSIPGVVYQSILDKDGKIYFTYINEGVSKIWGTNLTPEKIYKDSSIAYNIIHPDDVKKMMDSIPKDFDSVWTHEYRIITENGALRWMKSSANCFIMEDGSIKRNGSIMDITDLKSYQDKILTRDKQIFEISSSIPGAVYQFNITENNERKYNYISDGFYNLSGIKPEEMYKDPLIFINTIHPDDLDMIVNSMKSIRKNLGVYMVVYRIIDKKTGEEKWIRSNAIVSKINFNTVQFNGTLMDITEQKRSEKEKEKLLEDLNKKYNELMQFNYIVSHNLRAPVANILGLAEILKAETNPQEKEQIMEFILGACVEIDILIKDLNYVLSAKSSLNEKYELVNLFELIDSIKNSLGLPLISNEHTIKLYINENAINFYLIKAYIQSILFNLINNAIKYKDEKRRLEIKIRAYLSEPNLIIEVEDNGLGMDMEKVGKKLFGLYQRFNFTTDGKGLGLYMVKTQLETLGGTISVSSNVGIGSVFTIKLQLKDIIAKI